MVRLKTLILITVITLVATYASAVLYDSVMTPATPAVKATAVVQSKPDVYGLWQASNDERTQAGLPALALDERLNTSAKEKCDDMATRGYFAHTSPTGVEPWDIIHKYVDYQAAGENLAQGYHTSNAVTVGWMNSETHRANVLKSDFSIVGYAVCDGGLSGDIVVQHFARP